jgi:uncharacterized membrane protein YdjX (TVP38/TMEM64 family)
MLASGIGQLPIIIVYSLWGSKMNGAAQIGLYAFLVIAEILVLGFTVKKARQKGNNDGEKQATRPADRSAPI